MNTKLIAKHLKPAQPLVLKSAGREVEVPKVDVSSYTSAPNWSEVMRDREAAASEFVGRGTQRIHELGAAAQAAIDKEAKTALRANSLITKKTRIPMKVDENYENTVKMQQALYDAGFFGKTALNRAVDGIAGAGTRRALKAAEKAGYTYKDGKLVKASPTLVSKPTEPLNTTPVNSENYWDQVKDDPEFAQYLYSSGGQGTLRRAANLFNIGANYAIGLVNPSGKTVFDLGEGTERQAVGAALHNHLRGRTGITDKAHEELGGLSDPTQSKAIKHSGEEFRTDDKNLNWFQKIGKYAGQAMHSPYHNIYGQSADARFTENGFESYGDNYTFNNTWEGETMVKALGDGEGSMNFMDALKSGYDAHSRGTNLKAAMETAAANRGVNTARHSDVESVSLEMLNKWAKEYLDKKKSYRS